MSNALKGQEVGVYRETLGANVSLNALCFFTSFHSVKHKLYKVLISVLKALHLKKKEQLI